MKDCLRNLIVFVLFMIPVFGHAAAPSGPALPTPDTKPAAETAAPPPEPAPLMPAPETREADMQFPVMRTIGGMGIVVFLMVGAFFAAKKFAPRYFSKPVSQRNLKVIETLGMGDRRSISLIEVGHSRFLVGNTPHQINLLATLPEPVSFLSEPEEAVEAPKPASRKKTAAPFRNLFEVEKSRTPVQHASHPLPDDLRVKMRQLRDALERS